MYYTKEQQKKTKRNVFERGSRLCQKTEDVVVSDLVMTAAGLSFLYYYFAAAAVEVEEDVANLPNNFSLDIKKREPQKFSLFFFEIGYHFFSNY